MDREAKRDRKRERERERDGQETSEPTHSMKFERDNLPMHTMPSESYMMEAQARKRGGAGQ